MTERNDPPGGSGGSDDLFEDLDTFFSSMDQDDWPEPIPSESTQDRPPAQDRPKEQPSRQERPPAPPETEESPEPPRAADEPPAVAPPRTSGAPVEGTPSPAGPGGSRGEMSTADWTRLRDVLGEEDEEESEFGVADTPPPPATGSSLFGFPPSEEDEEPPSDLPAFLETNREPGAAEPSPEEAERHELTLEDLKKAPPEYRDLPIPPDESVPAPQGLEGSDEESWRPGADPAPSDPVDEGPEVAGDTVASEPPAPEEPEPELPDLPPEPTLAELQAAADRVAGEFGPEAEVEPEVPGGVEEDLLSELAEPSGPRTVKVGEPESMLGPAWEDPTARTLGPEPPRPPRMGGGRNLPAAVLTGIGLGLVAVITLLIASAAFAVLAGIVILFAQAELYATMHRRGFQPATMLGLVLGALTLVGAYTKGEAGMLFMLPLSLVLCFLWYMVAPAKTRSGLLANVAGTMFGIVYIPVLAGFGIVVLTQEHFGRALVLALIGLTFLYDIFAFAVGSIWGSRPLAPTISPKKSWEGLIGGSFVTILVAWAALPAIDPMNALKAIAFGLVVIVFAPLGDLAESALKRDLGVKDMGTIFPGHGGALDRIDSILFVAPAIFYFLRLVF
jgi:phosphatidate cytidylyltransferase